MKTLEVEMQKRMFGKRMKWFRRKNPNRVITFASINEATKIPESSLCQIEKGNMNIEYETMLKIIKALDTTVGEFFSHKMFLRELK